MSKTSFRVPAGVRADDHGIGGRYASVGGFLDVVPSLDDVSAAILLARVEARLEQAASEYAKLVRKFDNDPKRYAAPTAAAEGVLDQWQALADALIAQLETEPEEVETEPAEYEELPVEEYAADEWEIGFEYGALGGRSSNFDLALRMSREDGKPMTERQAMAALNAFRDGLRETGQPQEPPGYVFHSINWRRPGSSWRPHGHSGTMNDLAAFAAPLYTNADEPNPWTLRMGAVDT